MQELGASLVDDGVMKRSDLITSPPLYGGLPVCRGDSDEEVAKESGPLED